MFAYVTTGDGVLEPTPSLRRLPRSFDRAKETCVGWIGNETSALGAIFSRDGSPQMDGLIDAATRLTTSHGGALCTACESPSSIEAQQPLAHEANG